MKINLLFLLCFLCAKTFAIDGFKKGDKLYVLLKDGTSLFEKPDLKSKIKKELFYLDAVFVSEDKLKKTPFLKEEIPAFISDNPKNENFIGFSITGFWLKVISEDGIAGYVFDGYMTSLKSGFELTRDYFNKEFVLTKSVIVAPKKSDDYLFSNSYFYQNGAFIIEDGNDYHGSVRYFIPNITLQEGYMLIKSPDLFELQKINGKNVTVISGDKYNLSFSTKMEKRSLETKVGKINGVEIVFETWSKR